MNTSAPETHILQEEVSMKRKYMFTILIREIFCLERNEQIEEKKNCQTLWLYNLEEYLFTILIALEI